MKYSGRKKLYFKPDFTKGVDYGRSEYRQDDAAVDLSGFDYADGSLRTGYGIVAGDLVESGSKGVWMYRKDDTVMWAKDGVVKYKDADGNTQILGGISVSGHTYGVNLKAKGKDTIVIYSENGTVYWWDGEKAHASTLTEPIVSVEAFDSRIFVAVKGDERLFYSSPYNPVNFTEEGLDMSGEQGAINKIIAFRDGLYMFMDYAVYRITKSESYGYGVNKLYLEGGKIYADTACVCGNTMIFMTDSGFYSFGGSALKPVMKEIFPLIDSSQGASAAYHDGKYFLSAKTTEGTVLVCYDFEHATLTKNIGVGRLFCIGDRLFCYTNSMLGEVVKNGSYYGNPIPKRWVSPTMDFGTSRLKCIRSVWLSVECPITFTVSVDGVKHEFVADQNTTEIRMNLRGKRISFSIFASGLEALVHPFTVCYSVV